jgi:hypothetical protein
MGAFLRTNLDADWALTRGAARLLVAPEDQAFPDEINDVILTASGGTQYDPVADWEDLGATLGGITISTNHAEETLGVDQILADIESFPTNWEATVSTQLSENILEHFQLAWEGSAISTNATPSPDERSMGFGQPTEYTRRRLAVAFKNNDDLIRLFVFRRVQLQPIESQIAFNKTGEQQVIPVQFKALADSTVDEVDERFFTVFEQVGA